MQTDKIYAILGEEEGQEFIKGAITPLGTLSLVSSKRKIIERVAEKLDKEGEKFRLVVFTRGETLIDRFTDS